MRKNIAPLIDKMDILKQIHENYEVDFVLEIVPTIYSGDKNHCHYKQWSNSNWRKKMNTNMTKYCFQNFENAHNIGWKSNCKNVDKRIFDLMF